MAKIFLIANCVYLPISKEYDDKSAQKYFGASISGTIFPGQILTEQEIRENHKNSTYELREIDGFQDLWVY